MGDFDEDFIGSDFSVSGAFDYFSALRAFEDGEIDHVGCLLMQRMELDFEEVAGWRREGCSGGSVTEAGDPE